MNTTLKKIVAKAKELKKQAPNKFAKWTDYVKEASKTIKTKSKPVVKKAKKIVKKVSKKIGETHKDTNSHNVKLSITSGTGLRSNENTLGYSKKTYKPKDSLYTESIINEINRLVNQRIEANNKFLFNDKISKKHIDKKAKIQFKKYANEYKNLVKYYTKQINSLKSKIK